MDGRMDIERVKKSLLAPRGKRRIIKPSDLLGTGSTPLNLACSGGARGGFVKGHYHFYCGDTDSGKTWQGLSCLAEASINPAFDDYRLIYDPVEGGPMMDIERYFGERLAGRIEPPRRDRQGNPIYSDTVESFYFNVADALDAGKPFVYVEDSQDSLSSEAEKAKFDKDRELHKKGKALGGSFGDTKAKIHSAKLRRLMGPLLETGSILLILNQTRDSFDLFQRKTYSGGRALLFYAKMQLWSSVAGKIKRTVRGKLREVGTRCKVKVKKNHFRPGVTSVVEVPILYASGIDDIGGCADFLLDEGHWKGTPKKLAAPDFGFSGSREKLVRHVEEEGLEKDLRGLVAEVWGQVERASVLKRKPRY